LFTSYRLLSLSISFTTPSRRFSSRVFRRDLCFADLRFNKLFS
jgi:hypothetical protein